MEKNRSSKGQTPSVQHGGTLLPRQGVDSSDLAIFVCAVDGGRPLGQRVEERPYLHVGVFCCLRYVELDISWGIYFGGGAVLCYTKVRRRSWNVRLFKMAGKDARF